MPMTVSKPPIPQKIRRRRNEDAARFKAREEAASASASKKAMRENNLARAAAADDPAAFGPSLAIQFDAVLDRLAEPLGPFPEVRTFTDRGQRYYSETPLTVSQKEKARENHLNARIAAALLLAWRSAQSPEYRAMDERCRLAAMPIQDSVWDDAIAPTEPLPLVENLGLHADLPTICKYLADLPAMPDCDLSILAALARFTSVPQAAAMVHMAELKDDKDPSLLLTRTPAMIALASLAMEVVEVDGEAMATARPATKGRCFRRVSRPRQHELFPAPRTLDGDETMGIIFDTAASLPMSGDERSPLRADTIFLANFAMALSRAAELSSNALAILTTGKNAPANRRRVNRALWALREMRFEAEPGIFWPLADALPGEPNRIGPPPWWLHRGKWHAYRLTGGLLRKPSIWGGFNLTVGGLENALVWKSDPRAVRGIPYHLRPVSPGGPGEELFVPWWQVLYLAGELVAPDASPKSTAARRYRARMKTFDETGYFVPTGSRGGILAASAPIGDTIEIVRREKGGRGREAGILIRATARFCAAYAAVVGKKTQPRPVTDLIARRLAKQADAQ